MRVFDRYLLILLAAASAINLVLAFAGQKDLTVYFAVNVIAYLIITLLHAYLNPQARRLLNTIAVVLFAGFLVIVLLRVLGLLARGTPR